MAQPTFEIGDKVRTMMLGVEVTVKVIGKRTMPHGGRFQYQVEIPDDIDERANMRDPLERRYMQNLRRDGFWTYPTSMEFVDG